MTIDEAVRKTSEALSAAGVSEPRLDAELLVAHCIGTDPDKLFLKVNQPLTQGQVDQIERLAERRAKREPVQYILGRREFWSIDLKIRKGALIPRPETETLVEASIEFLQAKTSSASSLGETGPTIIDIGTGAGPIAIAIGNELGPNCRIIATDISIDALAVAKTNVRDNQLSNCILLVCCDMADAISFERLAQKVHLVVCNPPYIPTDKLKGLQPEVSQFEPTIALDGGPDGFAFYPRLMRIASDLLKKGGALICEIDPEMPLKLLGLWAGFRDRLATPRFIDDLSGRPRAALFVRL